MRKSDKTAAVILATLTIVISWLTHLDYNIIASEGLTLSSIVLAVYVAAILGLINTNLAKKMAATQAHAKSEFTQLGQLVIYFKYASAYTIATIVISSITLLLPAEATKRIFQIIIQCLSSIGFTVYALNLFFLAVILRFMLNRQLWNTCLNRLNSSAFSGTHLFCQHKAKRNTTHSGGVSFWSTFDLRCKSPACGDFYRKAEGNPRRFPPQTPPSSRRTKDSAFVRRKELAADTHARSAF